jgi:AcrR family transcriptional regulator
MSNSEISSSEISDSIDERTALEPTTRGRGDTRQQILDAALDLFGEQGYDKTSLREIAERVGVTKAALYYHFRSKEDLLVALIEPMSAMQDALLDDLRSDRLLDPTTWPDAVDRVLGAVLDNRRLVGLFERNAAALRAVKDAGPFGEEHEELHRRTSELFRDERLPLDQRVRLACAFGAVFGVLEVGGSPVLDDASTAELGPLVRDVVTGILAPVPGAVRS